MNQPFWPEVFDTKDISGKTDPELCAIGHLAWGNCMMGNKPHPNFGDVMVLISTKLGISGTPESFFEWSGPWLAAQDAKNKKETT